MQDFDFIQPTNLSELAEALKPRGRRILAGGTDLLPKMKRKSTGDDTLIDLSQVPELFELRVGYDHIQIGAMLTHARLAASDLVQTQLPALALACSLIGCRQTRYRATIGGNLANASPAADTAPVLLALAAELIITSASSQRTIPIDKFFLSPGKTCLASDEFITSVQVPMPGRLWGETYIKLGQRNGMSIAVASISVYMELQPDGTVHLIRVAAGSVAPIPIRCPSVEAALLGQIPIP